MKKLCVVGGGIASEFLLYFLDQSKFEITYFDGSSLLPTCSLNSTAIVSPFGMNEAKHEHARILKEAFHFSYSMYRNDFKNTVEDVDHQYINNNGTKDQFEKKFGHLKDNDYTEPALLIDARSFLKKLKEINSSKAKVIRELVNFSHDKKLNEQDYDLVVDCTGAYDLKTNIMKQSDSKLRKGNYLQWSIDLGEKGFHHDYFQEYYVSYRSRFKKLIIGSYNSNDNHFCTDIDGLKKIYNSVSLMNTYSLPAFDQAQLFTGHRQLGKKRESFCGQINENLWGIHSLYKNGWTLAPYYGKQLSLRLLQA